MPFGDLQKEAENCGGIKDEEDEEEEVGKRGGSEAHCTIDELKDTSKFKLNL